MRFRNPMDEASDLLCFALIASYLVLSVCALGVWLWFALEVIPPPFNVPVLIAPAAIFVWKVGMER